MNRTSIPIFILGILVGVACLFGWQSVVETDEGAVVISRTEQNTCADEDVDSDSGEVTETKEPRDVEPLLSTDLEVSSPDRTIVPKSDIESEPEVQDQSTEEALSLEEVKKSLPGFSDEELDEIKDEIDEVIKERMAGPKKIVTAKFSGVVVDALGNPMPNAGIYVELSERVKGGRPSYFYPEEIFQGDRQTTADSSGAWSLEITKSIRETSRLEVFIVAKAKNYVNSKRISVTIEDGDVKAGLKLLMRGQGSVKGRVVNQFGTGVEGVRVGLDPQGFNFGSPFYFGATYKATTDSEGYYRFEELTEGIHTFSIDDKGFRVNSSPGQIMVKSNEENVSKTDYIVVAISHFKFALVSDTRKLYGLLRLTLLSEKGEDVYSANEQAIYDFFLNDAAKIIPVVINEPPIGTFRLKIELAKFETKIVILTIDGREPTDLGEIKLVEVDKD